MVFDRKVTLHRRRALVQALPIPLLLVTLVMAIRLVAGFPTDEMTAPLLIDSAVFAGVLWFWARRRNPWPEKVEGQLVAGPDGVSVDGRQILARRELRRGYVQPWAKGPPTVRLIGRLGLPLLEVAVADEEEGRALLDALELGVAHQATRFNSLSPFFATSTRRILVPTLTVAFILGATVGFKLLDHLEAARIVPSFFSLISILYALPTSIHVGADGVLVTWLWRRKFYPHTDIAGVKVQGSGVRLWLHSGEAVDLPGSARRGRSLEKMRLDAQVARIRAALDGARERQSKPVEVAALVSRGGRTAAEWARAVREILGGAGGDYRTSAVPEENLWRVAEDPTAEETARVGAAVALRTKLDDEGRARMLRVAEASVSPKVRVALRAAASEEEEALLEALESYEALAAAAK